MSYWYCKRELTSLYINIFIKLETIEKGDRYPI